MSRGVRDLRDLICVSRLTFHGSDEEQVFSEEEGISHDLDNLSLGSASSCDSRNGNGKPPTSPDSGCITNGGSPPQVGISGLNVVEDSEASGVTRAVYVQSKVAAPKPPEDGITLYSKKHRRRNKKKKVLETTPSRHDLPKPPPLPPVGLSGARSSLDSSRPGSNLNNDFDIDEESKPLHPPNAPRGAGGRKGRPLGNFDDMLSYMDATVVSGWLTRSNELVNNMSEYCLKGDHFVQFAHFWLNDFPDVQKREIYELEIEILTEELGFAFAVGKEQRKISHRDIQDLIGALFREYPAKLLGSRGAILFLDYLDILSSIRTAQYKKLLSDVKCSTKNKQYAQWLLATRSFALVSVWSAVVNFYRNLLGANAEKESSSIIDSALKHKSVHEKRLYQAMRLGYADVVHYLIVSGHVDPNVIDSHNRTLVFTAVTYNQPKVLHCLLTRVKPPINVNEPSDTGNTALHAAANNGNAMLVEELLRAPDINVDCMNPQCENATPLLLSVMHGHTAVVDLLLKAGADREVKMGKTTVLDLARDFHHEDIVSLLQS